MIHCYLKLGFGSCSKYQGELGRRATRTEFWKWVHIFSESHTWSPALTLWNRGELVIQITFGCLSLATVFLKSLFLRWRYYVRLIKGKFWFCKLQSGRKNIEDVMKKQNKPEKTPNSLSYSKQTNKVFWFLVILFGWLIVISEQSANAVGWDVLVPALKWARPFLPHLL